MPNGEQYDEPTEGPADEGSDQTTWIVGGIVVLVLIGSLVFFFWGDGDEEPATPTEEEPAQMAADQPDTPAQPEPELELPDMVDDYIRQARQSFEAPEGREKFKHEYTAERLKSLGDALVAFAGLLENEVNLEDAKSTLREKGEAIQRDWKDRHSDDVRAAFLEATRAFETLNENVEGMNGEVREVRERAESIDEDTLYLEQKSKAEAFFSKSADLFDALFERLKNSRSGMEAEASAS